MDIRADYPANKGFSVRNLKYMVKFAATYSEQEFVQQAVAQIPWGHNIVLLDKITDSEQRRWYAETCQKNGWSRNVLIHQIESGLYERQVLNSKVSNFKQRLPSPQSELSTQTMKDPYVFDFIPFREDMLERDIEQALVRDVTKLLLELGTGFAFWGNQYHLNVGGDDFYINLLFYNLNLRCYVVVELKRGVQAGICWATQLLSISSRWYFKEECRQPIHRPTALQEQKQSRGRILLKRHIKAYRRERI